MMLTKLKACDRLPVIIQISVTFRSEHISDCAVVRYVPTIYQKSPMLDQIHIFLELEHVRCSAKLHKNFLAKNYYAILVHQQYYN